MQRTRSERFDRWMGGMALVAIAIVLLVEPRGLLDKIDRIGFAVCHQFASRSYFYSGQSLPICARCSGTFLAAVAGLLALNLRHGGRRIVGFPARRYLPVLAVFVTAWIVDGLNSFTALFPGLPHLYEPDNLLRLITGTLQGLAVAAFLLPLFHSSLWADVRSEASIGSLSDICCLIAAGAGVVLLVSSGRSFLFFPLAIVSGLAVVCLIGSLNTMALLVALHREGTAQTWRDIVSPTLAGIAAGMIELLLIGLARDALSAWTGIVL